VDSLTKATHTYSAKLIESPSGLGSKTPLKIIQSYPCHGQGPLPQPRVLPAPSSLALNPVREGAATAPLGSPGRGLSTLTAEHFFLMSDLNLPSVS